MSKLVLLVVCVAVFQLANSLSCYHCEKEKCESDKDWQKSDCGKTALPNQSAACLKYVYTDNASKKDMTSRKCVFVEKDKKYDCGTTAGALVSCETCTEDNCNSAPTTSIGLAAVCGIILTIFIPRILA